MPLWSVVLTVILKEASENGKLDPAHQPMHPRCQGKNEVRGSVSSSLVHGRPRNYGGTGGYEPFSSEGKFAYVQQNTQTPSVFAKATAR